MSREFEEIPVAVNNYSELEDVDLHLLPCTIEYNGPAKVSEYFKPSIITKDSEDGKTNKEFSASFRGRPLEGGKISLPAGYVGVIMGEPNNGSQDISLTLKNKFHEINYWNLDCPPSSNDKIVQAMKWIDMSRAIHSSAKEDSLSQSSVISN